MSVAENIANLRREIGDVSSACERDPQSVTLMAVTKTVSPERIGEAFAAGLTLIGENRVQEIKAKRQALAAVVHRTHLIGHLQSNKIRDIIGLVDCIESLDHEKLAQKLQSRLEFIDRTIDVYVQVNTSGEASKSGVAPEEAMALIREVVAMDRLRLKGLMTIARHSADAVLVRGCFRRLVALQQRARDRFSDRASFDVLSMGMSGDWRLAIAEGATLIRVGSAIFGARHDPAD